MRYSLSDAKRIYDFFDRDFFYRNFKKRVGRCKITTDTEEARSWFSVEHFDGVSGVSYFDGRKKRIYLNRYLLDNLKCLANTILHEMIHLYDQMENPNKRDYRSGHGAFWTKIASLANQRYGRRVGVIERYSSSEETCLIERSKLIHSTKSLSGSYIVILENGTKIPVKSLSAIQVERLKHSPAVAVYRVHSNLRQTSRNRVKKILNFDKLLEVLDGRKAYQEPIDIDLNEEADAIFTNMLSTL